MRSPTVNRVQATLLALLCLVPSVSPAQPSERGPLLTASSELAFKRLPNGRAVASFELEGRHTHFRTSGERVSRFSIPERKYA